MQWFVMLILCALAFTRLNARPKNTKTRPPHKSHPPQTFTSKGNIDAYKYFTQFGYNPCENPTRSTSRDGSRVVCSTSFESMLESFQIAFGLNVTKKLDAATESLMRKPRCSLPDFPAAFTDRSGLW